MVKVQDARMFIVRTDDTSATHSCDSSKLQDPAALSDRHLQVFSAIAIRSFSMRLVDML